MRTAMVLRWGAFGDLIFASPVFRLLKEDGYHVTVSVTERGADVIRNNPYIDKVELYVDNTVPNDERLAAYWTDLASKYDRFINLSETIERKLLALPGDEMHKMSKEERHERCNVNYIDATLEAAGYGHVKGLNGEMYFSPFEESFARDYRKKYKGRFIILWSLSGSSLHKVYPFTELVAKAFLDSHPDAMILTVGDHLCELLEWSHPRTKCYSGKWGIRKSMLMAKHADLVIGTETGVLNAAGCFDTPKILLLSHSTAENLAKYWRNAVALEPTSECYPCHKMHYSLDTCELHPELGTPNCAASIKPADILRAMNDVYLNWRKGTKLTKGGLAWRTR